MSTRAPKRSAAKAALQRIRTAGRRISSAQTKVQTQSPPPSSEPLVENDEDSQPSENDEDNPPQDHVTPTIGTAQDTASTTEDLDDGETEMEDIVTTTPDPPHTRMGSVRFQEAEEAPQEQDTDTPSTRYRQRRLALMISIPEVDNNSDCLHHIVIEVNNFLKAARKKNAHFRLRKFEDINTPDPAERKQWRTKMNQDSSSDFKEYIHGYYPFTPPRGGQYRLRINTVMDNTEPLATFLENVTHDWGQRDTRSISDIKAQRIWDPVKIGYLMRASRYITHSYELVDALEKAANANSTASKIYFGTSWGTIPSPVGGYDKETSVQAVMIETNKQSQEIAVALLKGWYPLDPARTANPPYPGNFRFVMNRDNTRVRGNPVALANLSILMERQGIFNQDTKGEQTFCLQDLNMPYKGGQSISVRDKLLQTKIRTLSDDLKGSPLFLSISTAVNNRNNNRSVWFTFHKKVAQEAVSIVRNLPIFIKEEWNIQPEYACFSQFIHPSDKWDSTNRVANNEDTDDIKMAAEVHTMDLKRTSPEISVVEEDDEDSMHTKARREMKRMLDNDEETIVSVSKRKTFNPRPSAIVIDDTSQGGISMFSGASSRSSVIRAKMQKDFDTKMAAQQEIVNQLQKDKDQQNIQQAQLAKQLQQLQQALATLTTGTVNQPNQEFEPMESMELPIQNLWEEPESSMMDTQFDTNTVDADYSDLVADIENKIIGNLDHEPDKGELLSIGIEAQKLAAEFDRETDYPAQHPLPASPNDSDSAELTPIKTATKHRLRVTDSDEQSDPDTPMETSNTTDRKRIAVTPSDDTADQDKGFKTSASSSPKKKYSTTGGSPPKENV